MGAHHHDHRTCSYSYKTHTPVLYAMSMLMHRPPPPGRPASPSWNQNEAATPSNRHWRDAEPVRRRWDDPPERWGHREPDRWEGSDRRRPPPEYAPSVLLRDDLDDATLFPPAPTRPMASVSDGADSTNAEEDPERAAFEQELERLASQLHKVVTVCVWWESRTTSCCMYPTCV